MELGKDVTVDPHQIDRVTLVKKGAKIGAKIATMPASDADDLRAPDDELIVHLKTDRRASFAVNNRPSRRGMPWTECGKNST